MNFAALLLPLLLQGPTLFADAEEVFNDIAHGEGGVAKLQNVVGALAHLLGHAAGAIGNAPPAPPPPPVIEAGPAL